MSLLLFLAFAFQLQANPRETMSGYIDVDGGAERIYYESTGSGEAVVLSHGAGGNHAIWMHQVPALAQTHRVITWDQRGWGKSTNHRKMAGRADIAVEDLRALLDHLAIERAHVVGQSMGGWVVAGFALQYPDRTHSLTLANTYGGISTEAMRQWLTPQKWAEVRQRAEAAGRPNDIADDARAFQYSQVRRLAPPRGPENLGDLLFGKHWDIAAARALKMPVLIVTGTYDGIFAPEMMRMLHNELKGSQLYEIENAGHSPYFERPGEWNRVVLKHLGH